jgi:NAD(P)-dependent dehydrogenase (short-subunit alcohol dehydrogenase family)
MSPAAPAPAVLVTGVSSGIGLAIAQDLLARGYRVFGSVRREADADALVVRHGKAFVPLVFDVTDEPALQAAVALVTAELGEQGLKALVNNAGISHLGPIALQPMAEIRAMFEVNVFGLLMVTRAFLPLLGARRGATHPPGRVVNIGSLSGGVTVPFVGGYSASKHAVEALGQAFRRELQPFGVHVTTIEPGFIRSRMVEKSSLGTAEAQYGATDYGAIWRQFLKSTAKQAQAAKPPEVVTQAVIQAIESPHPRSRHPLDPLWRIGQLLSDRGFDGLIFKALGIATLMRSPR